MVVLFFYCVEAQYLIDLIDPKFFNTHLFGHYMQRSLSEKETATMGPRNGPL